MPKTSENFAHQNKTDFNFVCFNTNTTDPYHTAAYWWISNRCPHSNTTCFRNCHRLFIPLLRNVIVIANKRGNELLFNVKYISCIKTELAKKCCIYRYSTDVGRLIIVMAPQYVMSVNNVVIRTVDRAWVLASLSGKNVFPLWHYYFS